MEMCHRCGFGALLWAPFPYPWLCPGEGWSWGRRRLADARLAVSEPPYGPLVAGLVAGQVLGPEPRPVRRVGGRRRVAGLERLVAAVVRRAAGEVGAAGRLHHAVHH